MALNANYNKYEVTFTENKKYNPVTRTVLVHAFNEYQAEIMVHMEFGSVNFDDKNSKVIPSNKIKIEKINQKVQFGSAK